MHATHRRHTHTHQIHARAHHTQVRITYTRPTSIHVLRRAVGSWVVGVLGFLTGMGRSPPCSCPGVRFSPSTRGKRGGLGSWRQDEARPTACPVSGRGQDIEVAWGAGSSGGSAALFLEGIRVGRTAAAIPPEADKILRKFLPESQQPRFSLVVGGGDARVPRERPRQRAQVTAGARGHPESARGPPPSPAAPTKGCWGAWMPEAPEGAQGVPGEEWKGGNTVGRELGGQNRATDVPAFRGAVPGRPTLSGNSTSASTPYTVACPSCSLAAGCRSVHPHGSRPVQHL